MSEKVDSAIVLQQIIFGFMGIKGFNPVVSTSARWKVWVAVILPTTCTYCKSNDGHIFDEESKPEKLPKVHEHCKCNVEKLSSIKAGTATIDKDKGADYTIKHFNKLPDNYIDKLTAKKLGWVSGKGNLRDVAPNSTIGGDVFYNDKGKLPSDNERVWHEADINYTGGYRSMCRILYSNDGLIFVTYDHYETFYEIV